MQTANLLDKMQSGQVGRLCYWEHKIHPLSTVNGPGNEFQARILVALPSDFLDNTVLYHLVCCDN